MLSGSLNLSEKCEYHMIKSSLIVDVCTLIASVRIAATTSRDPPSTRLFSNSGSYSQIAFVFSMTAIFVMCPITATFARFTTCSRHLPVSHGEQTLLIRNMYTYGSWFSPASHRRLRRSCCCSTVSQLVVLFEALSRVMV